MGKLVTIVIPAFNEEGGIGDVLTRLAAALPEQVAEIVVVDDGSTDRTAEIAIAAGVRVIRHPVNRGYGASLKTAIKACTTDYVLTMDADGQHLPEELPVMIAPIVSGEADYVNGSRLLGTFERESVIRHLGVHFFSGVVTVLTGRRVTDISSGYRAARADLLRHLVLEQDQFWTSEILIEALRNRARVVEVPVTFLARAGGESKKPKSFRYGWNFLKVIIQTWLR